MTAPEPVIVTLADGTKLGEVDPHGTPIEWREGGGIRWYPGYVLRVHDDTLPTVVLEYRHGRHTYEFERPAAFVRLRRRTW